MGLLGALLAWLPARRGGVAVWSPAGPAGGGAAFWPGCGWGHYFVRQPTMTHSLFATTTPASSFQETALQL